MKNKNFELVNNSPKEIEESIINMDKYIRGELDLKKELSNQKNFGISFISSMGFD